MRVVRGRVEFNTVPEREQPGAYRCLSVGEFRRRTLWYIHVCVWGLLIAGPKNTPCTAAVRPCICRLELSRDFRAWGGRWPSLRR